MTVLLETADLRIHRLSTSVSTELSAALWLIDLGVAFTVIIEGSDGSWIRGSLLGLIRYQGVVSGGSKW